MYRPFMARWLKNKRCQECPASPLFYKQVGRVLCDKDISKIDDEAFEKYKAHRLKTVSIAMVDRELLKRERCLVWRVEEVDFR
jgi:hypothetical protein